MESSIKDLSKYRFETALESLEDAKCFENAGVADYAEAFRSALSGKKARSGPAI